jgi:hypothetical protein
MDGVDVNHRLVWTERVAQVFVLVDEFLLGLGVALAQLAQIRGCGRGKSMP